MSVDAVSVDAGRDGVVPDAVVPDVVVPEARETDQPRAAEPARDVALDAKDHQLTAADERLTELTELLMSTDRQISAGTARVDAVEASVGDLADRLSAVQSRVSSVDAAVGRATTQIGSIAPRLASVDGRLAGIDERTAALDEDVATLRHHAADHDRALGDLKRTIAAEVERHTSDALVTAQHSLHLAVNSIAQLSLAMAESSRDLTEDVSAESATALLDSFRVDLDAVLAQLGFEPLGAGVGDAFDPHRHRALKRVPTSDPARDKSITAVIRDGYRSMSTGRILLFADVEVGRLRT